MNLHEAQTLARTLMDQHGLAAWTFRFDRSRRRFGVCKPGLRAISLSAYLTHLNSVDEVRDTILHEIAHALEPKDGHGQRWKARCIAIGARPTRCYTSEEVIAPPRRDAPYLIGCTRCDWWHDRRKLAGKRLLCRKCMGDVTYRHKQTGTEFVVEVLQRGWRTKVVKEPVMARQVEQ